MGRHRSAQPVLTPRDLAALTWVAEQQAVTLEQLSVLLARLSTGPVPGQHGARPQCEPGRLATSTTRNVVARWRKLGLVLQGQVTVEHDTCVWLTAAGMELLGLEFKARPLPLISELTHTLTLAGLRLHIETFDGYRWISEAELARDWGIGKKFNETRHLPDALVVGGTGEVFAIEAELSVKENRRLDQILAELTSTRPAGGYGPAYDTVLYWCPAGSKVHSALERARERLGPDRAQMVRILPLPDELVLDRRPDRR